MLTNGEINVLIAEKVMGEPCPKTFPQDWYTTLHRWLDGEPVESEGGNWIVAHLYENDDIQEWIPKPFATSIEHVWQVVKFLRKQEWRVTITSVGDKWQCWGDKTMKYDNTSSPDFGSTSDTVEHSICLAALDAFGVTVK